MNLAHKSEKMAALYKENPKVKAILLAGSVSKNLHDEHSDIELHILWASSPTDEDRQNPIERIDGKILSYHPYEDEEWSEAYLDQDGVKYEISSFLYETITHFVSDVIDGYETNFDKQCILASIHHGESLYGGETINEFKNRVAAYPLALSENMISENLWFSNRWNNRKALLKREDWLMLYDVICNVEKNLFAVLFGLNQMYIQHPVFKWMYVAIEKMHIKPDHLYERMSNSLLAAPEEGVKELEVLVEEVIQLVEKHHPELEISDQKNHIGYVK